MFFLKTFLGHTTFKLLIITMPVKSIYSLVSNIICALSFYVMLIYPLNSANRLQFAVDSSYTSLYLEIVGLFSDFVSHNTVIGSGERFCFIMDCPGGEYTCFVG